jgi:dienelactone hydrolase
MLEYLCGADVAVIVIHEIYGLNGHIEAAAKRLAAAGYDVYCPDLSGRPAFAYAEEALAYRHFHEQVGFAGAREAVDRLAGRLAASYSRLYIVGYSMGATVGWLCSQSGVYAGVIGFYGSRIRDYPGIRPACPVLLFYPRHEPSFSVAELIAALGSKSGVEISVVEAGHGFADPCGPHHHPGLAAEAFRRLEAFIGSGSIWGDG